MARYKVALVCDWYLPRIGGLELHLHDLARELNARGHEAHVICVTPGGNPDPGITVHRLPVRPVRWMKALHDGRLRGNDVADRMVGLSPWLSNLRDGHCNALLEEVLRRGGYDVVHAHNCFSPLAHAGTYLARRLGIPSVFTEHSVLRGPGVYAFRAVNQVVPWTTWPTVLTAVSSYVAEDLRLVSGRSDVQVLHNGINPEEWHIRRSEPEQPRVLTVGRFTVRKQQIDLIRAIPLVLRELPAGITPRFTVVGDGPQRARVEREAIRLGVAQHVEFPGLRSRAEIRTLMGRSTMFVLPSEKEALPISLLEARSAGLPIVARTPNGASDIVTQGQEGFLAGSVEDFARSIARLIVDAPLRRRMGDTGRRHMERFSWDRVIHRHVELYGLAGQRLRPHGRGGESMLPDRPMQAADVAGQG